MGGFLVAAIAFLCLAGAALGSLLLHVLLPVRHRQEDTNAVVRLVAHIFIVMTSLVLGLMMNSAKTTYETIDKNVHAYATEIILLDRTIRQLGPAADAPHRRLIAYVRYVLDHGPIMVEDKTAEEMLDAIGSGLNAVKPADDRQITIWSDARELYRNVVRQRWILVEQSEGTVPMPIIVIVIAWLSLIFASFGYRAPRNAVVVASFVGAALLIAASIYLMLDMTVPFSGAVQVADEPLRRALAELPQ